jgi:septal ring factor EnvC (AmiA/AmiB activator)
MHLLIVQHAAVVAAGVCVMQALASQARSHTEALGQLTQQYQEACTRLAAASSEEGELRQQLARTQRENQQLQQQVRQVGSLGVSLLPADECDQGMLANISCACGCAA